MVFKFHDSICKFSTMPNVFFVFLINSFVARMLHHHHFNPNKANPNIPRLCEQSQWRSARWPIVANSLELHKGLQLCALLCVLSQNSFFIILHIKIPLPKLNTIQGLVLLKSPFSHPAPLLDSDTMVTVQVRRSWNNIVKTKIINIC